LGRKALHLPMGVIKLTKVAVWVWTTSAGA
jgi:hypothetical protein